MIELDAEAAITRRLLERIPGDKFDWKPHDKSMQLGHLAWHIALTPGQVAEACKVDVFSMSDFPQAPTPSTTREVLEAFEQGIEKARTYLEGLGDATAMATWKIVDGDREMMNGPRIEFLRTVMMNHTYHHRGQFSVYLRLLGVPVPSIYGPSADENPWEEKPSQTPADPELRNVRTRRVAFRYAHREQWTASSSDETELG